MKDDAFRVRTMSPEEVALAVDWAAAEGWNPGLTDASCFAAAAPDAFLLGELAGEPAAILWQQPTTRARRVKLSIPLI
jgi:hypothetical protein